jgi:hypothetical protein
MVVTDGFPEYVVKAVDFEHPWVAKYRIPVTASIYAPYPFTACLLVPVQEGMFLKPSEEDAQLMARFIQFKHTSPYSFLPANAADLALDVDPGVNTVTFARMPHSWVYRMETWTMQTLFPDSTNSFKFETLEEAMLHSVSQTQRDQWDNFMNEVTV